MKFKSVGFLGVSAAKGESVRQTATDLQDEL